MKLKDEAKNKKISKIEIIATVIVAILGIVCYILLQINGIQSPVLFFGMVFLVAFIGFVVRLIASYILYVVKE